MLRLTTYRAIVAPAAFYAVTCFVLWMVPLFNILHAESSAVIAGISFFVAGFAAAAQFRAGTPLHRVFRTQALLLLIPWALLTFTLLWQPNCSYGQGLLFFLLFTLPSVWLAVALAFFLDAAGIAFKKTAIVLAGLLLALGGVIFDLGFHAQFFTYNHVFGGVLGPIYDEELTIRAGLLAFRLRTCLLGLFLVLLAAGFRPHSATKTWVQAGVVGMLLLLTYVFAAPLRINTPAWFIRKHLDGHFETAHFDMYYDTAAIDSAGVARLAQEHEYRYHFIQSQLGIDVSQRIQTYIYPDAERKHWLTGSRNTSVTPVWLAVPQMHILHDVFNDVFPHELAHVFSREFGLPVIRASLSVGLVEGLAVALEPPDGRPTPHEQVLTAVTLATPPGTAPDINGQIKLASRLSPLGFWGGRGAVSYTTMGSFVRFLADTYGYARVMEVYASSDFERVFQKPIETLVAEWADGLVATPYVDRAAQVYASRRFSIPSLFEKDCPHHLPAHERLLREGAAALSDGDTLAALQNIEDALARAPAYEPALDAWAALHITRGDTRPVIDRLLHTLQDTTEMRVVSAGLWVRLGDALALEGAPDEAVAAFDSARVILPLYAHQQHGLIALRQALADMQLVQQINRSADSTAGKVARLDALLASARMAALAPEKEQAVRVLQGVLLALDESNEAALRYLAKVDATQMEAGGARTLARLARVVRAFLHYRVGNFEEARAAAEAIALEFEAVGAFNAALEFSDFADKMHYIIMQQ